MNSAPKFLGFILIPIVAFAIGYHVASENILIKNNQNNIKKINDFDSKTQEEAISIVGNLLNKNVNLKLVSEILEIINKKYILS